MVHASMPGAPRSAGLKASGMEHGVAVVRSNRIECPRAGQCCPRTAVLLEALYGKDLTGVIGMHGGQVRQA